MKNVVSKIKSNVMYLGMFFLALGISACSDDDDGVAQLDPTGLFEVNEQQTLIENSIVLERITVGQDSWLAAVKQGEENSNNFIAQPVKLTKGENNDVMLTFDEGAINDDGSGQQVVLKLYADSQTQGTTGEWDPSDEPITDNNNALMTETITVFAESNGSVAFADFDLDGDGKIDRNELPNVYQNNFSEWDADGDNMLNNDEFNATTFSLTDTDNDESISEEEWNEGYAGFFGNWNEDSFATFDADADGSLTSEEWNNAFAESEWFGTFDADDDDNLTEAEWDEGLFNSWDANEDDGIDEDEFNTFFDFTGKW